MSGSMARDFLAGQLTDRLFTLMGFLHLLGQPILLVFALWIHVKRLSHVNITAPRGLAVGSLLALLALSLLAPATSHAPADLSRVPAVLKLDWFYLNVYPLLDKWPADQVWMLTTGITVLLMLMPWLPPKKTGPAAEVHLDQCNGCGQCAEDCPFDAITVTARSDGARWKNEVVVNPAQCAACGICVGSCHSSNPFRHATKTLETGIDMPQFPIEEIRARTDAVLAGLSGDTRIILFGCDNAVDIKEFESQDVAVLGLFCTGMIPPTLIEYAQRHGADGVFITGCRSGDCYYRLGNEWLDQRFMGRRKPALRQRAQRDRIMVYRAAETDTAKLRRRLAEFKRDIAALRHEETAAETGRERESTDA